MTNSECVREAIRLAIDGVNANHGGPFGAVIVKDGDIIGRGCNRVTSKNDPTAHAEIVAIRDACQTLGVYQLADCELYASCEPCPMCLAAIYWSRIGPLLLRCSRRRAAAVGFSDESIRRELVLLPPERTVAAEQLLQVDALAPFEAWKAKADRLPY